MVRAKFTVNVIKEGVIYLTPVVDGSEENKMFFSYTPWGEIRIGTVNQEAIKEFKVGKEYYVDFTEAK